MGARQRGQARAKNKASPKGGAKGSPRSPKKSRSTLQVHDLNPVARSAALKGWEGFASSESAASSLRNGFSMAQEAKNTERHVSRWGNTRLRDNAISFVSAGNLVREEPQSSSDDNDPQEAGAIHDSIEEAAQLDNASDLNRNSDLLIANGRNSAQIPFRRAPAEASRVQDLTEPEASARDEQNDVGQDISSEAEEIVFHGRSKSTVKPVPSPRKFDVDNTPGPSMQKSPHIIAAQPFTIPQRPRDLQQQVASSSEGPSSWKPKRNRASRLAKRRAPRCQQVSDEEEAIMQDYIANMAVDNDDDDDDEGDEGTKTNKPQRRNETFRFYYEAGDENVKVQTISKLSTPTDMQIIDQAGDWSSADLEDFDDLDTTEDEIDEIGQVLRHRERPDGPQYLVTAVGKGASDAKWMRKTKLTSRTAADEIRIYHEIQTLNVEVEDGDTDSSSSRDDEALDDLNDDIESEGDENAQVMSRTARMSDEQIARTLAKQEELGMGGDQLLIFDGQEDDDEEEDVFRNGSDFVPFSLSKNTSNRTRSKKNQRQRDSFPSAGAFADALDQDPYGGFDVMDFDRPSVRSKRKGQKGDFASNFELSDDELAQHLRDAWNRDRQKKATRKREKMEAREAELSERADRSHPSAIKSEIRRFLVEETETLRLAPMDSHTRASVHRLAKSLNLASQSEGKEGKGLGRYPILTKTDRTAHYAVDTIWEIDALMNQRKFFPKHNPLFSKSKMPKTPRARGAGGRGLADASFKNGEIVGASAPELSVDNKGRAMLEKMGWASGMGIGAVGNKGSLEAVKQVVKTNKAGLG